MRSDTCNCVLMRSRDSRSVNVTSAPIRVPPSVITCTLNAHAPRRRIRPGQNNLGGSDRLEFAVRQFDGFPHRMIGRKNIFRAAPQKLVRRHAQKSLDGRTDHDGAAIERKQQQTVIESAEDLVEILAQRAEDFPDAAQLHSDLADFRADLAEFIAALERFLVEFALRNAVQLGGNALQGSQRTRC